MVKTKHFLARFCFRKLISLIDASIIVDLAKPCNYNGYAKRLTTKDNFVSTRIERFQNSICYLSERIIIASL